MNHISYSDYYCFQLDISFSMLRAYEMHNRIPVV